MERTECKLCTRFAYGLCSDDTDGLTLLYQTTGCEITAITLSADTTFALTSKH